MTSNDRSRWPALVVLCAGMLMIILDQTVVNVALPAIQADLGFSQNGLAWVVNAYLIAFGGLLLLAGRIGDLVGRKRVFLGGLVLFTAASLLCGLSVNPAMLVTMRFLQGLGGAFTSSVILGVIVTTFREQAEQAKAMAIFSFVAASGGAIGLLAGGVLTQALNWHCIFFVNLPIGALAFVLGLRLIEADDGLGLTEGADAPGAVLVTAALMLGVYTIVEAERYGWLSAHTIGLGAVALALLATFGVRQTRVATPLLPLRVFRSRNTTGANAIQMLMVAGLFGMFFLGSLYLQRVVGYDSMEIGLAFLPVAVGIGALSLGFSARLNARFGERAVLIPSLVFISAGLLLFTRVGESANYVVDLLPTMVLFGIGGGLAFPALMTLAMSEAGEDDAGVVSGLVNTTQQVGGALGLAVLATLASSRTEHLATAGHATRSALLGGYHLAFAISAALVLAALVGSVFALRAVPVPVAVREPEFELV